MVAPVHAGCANSLSASILERIAQQREVAAAAMSTRRNAECACNCVTRSDDPKTRGTSLTLTDLPPFATTTVTIAK